ncbi:MAG: queuosine precursor transporter [Flavobacteriales bacterium]|nr:queuosine precursor transporter [Flavobacteriales bacterium]
MTDVNSAIEWRRTVVFMTLSGLFLGSLTMLNILGTSRFIDLGTPTIPFNLAVGVLPYPITFLCTDLISELFGRKKANLVVWIGLMLNLWVLLILWLGGILDAPDNLTDTGQIPLVLDEFGKAPAGYAFYEIRHLTFVSVIASMVAYLFAQLVDVQIFHWIKKKTKGKKLWLRNNISTLMSQMIDSIAVILITFYLADVIHVKDPSESVLPQLFTQFIIPGYVFKLVIALLDTFPFIWCTKFFKKYLHLTEN